ncbi:MAG: ribosome recycling factor [Candidatus Buchananbacteria bacterium RIFCSPLOWO2_01_FULL_46_12]|uniref:Ribosome-recycling factor n=2 Tax=Candidatus Buchananiibacteriota TaxID=1817903 RepID=A0A1G1YNG0_9BACT|nr:MAG: ribosome recycling factor [Candidatus Buchananbacteria bacterium RIFCSPHIGHO2_01_FULL_44_11]OGY53888.1 MAG: ribosome recycling factor [Candidatus Buchananbacteria bacterium RIFCSPLOWO2_01_FULL_46_12]
MHSILAVQKEKFDQALDRLQEELATLRVGRANPLLVENILVEAYGTRTPIKQLASVTVPETRTLLVQPWDKSIIKDVEKGIIAANIGIAPVNEGTQIRLTIPQLTEESRKELTKSVAEKEEKARIALRQIRDKIKEDIVKQERANALTEDDRYNVVKDLDEVIKEYNDKIKEISEIKAAEIMKL